MRRILLASLAVVLSSVAVAEDRTPDILDRLYRGLHEHAVYKGISYDVIRTPQADGSTLVEYKLPVGLIAWYTITIRKHQDGPKKGLVYEAHYGSGTTETLTYAVDEAGRIQTATGRSVLPKQISRDPSGNLCNVVGPNCHPLDTNPALSWTMQFHRDPEGALKSGNLITVWHLATRNEPIVSNQRISFEKPAPHIERMRFLESGQPWAYPHAGYEVETAADGTHVLHVCFSFLKSEGADQCVTTSG